MPASPASPRAPLVEERRQGEVPQVYGGHALGPHRLPDPGLGCVPDAATAQPLLAPGVVAGVAVVLDRHDQDVGVLAERVGDVAGERQIPAGVAADRDVVQVDPAGLVDRAEVQQQARAGGVEARREGQRTAVPERLARLELPPDAGERGLRRERHEDLAVVAFGLGGRAGDRVLPPAVEVETAVPGELRAGILGQDTIRVERGTPWGQQRHARASRSRRRSATAGTAMRTSTASAMRKMPGVGTCFTTPRSS